MPDMRSPLQAIRSQGGAAKRQTLVQLGFTPRQLRAEVASGTLIAVTRSWLAAPDTDDRVLTALRLGGVAGGETSLESYGVWVTHKGQCVVAFKQRSHRRRTDSDARCMEGCFSVDPRAPWRVSLIDALAQLCRRSSRLDAIASIDSALRTGLLRAGDLHELARRLPQAKRSWLSRVNGRADSGLESILRVACEDEGWDVAIQVPFRGGRIDLVINGWLCIEIDGAEFHDVAGQARKDRQRNNQISADGLRWHRFSYADIVHNLDRSMATLRTIMAQQPPAVS